LPFGKSRGVGVIHLAAKLPVEDFGHGFSLHSCNVKRVACL
jgi:hypothetical protein